jgi:cytochrome P450
MTKGERINEWNCLKVREFTRDIVQKRKSGEFKSKAEGEVDLLNLFLSNRDAFSDEDIVDELLDFFAAAAETS